MMLSPKRSGLAAIAVALVAVGAKAQQETPASDDFTETQCAQLAALSEADRAFSLIFYYGYMAGRSKATTIDNTAIDGHLAAVRDYCNDNPESTVVDAFVAALK